MKVSLMIFVLLGLIAYKITSDEDNRVITNKKSTVVQSGCIKR